MTEDFVQRWSQIREKGKWHYIILRGVLLFGITVSAVSLIFLRFIFNEPITWSRLTIIPILMAINGYISWNEWRKNEKRFGDPKS